MEIDDFVLIQNLFIFFFNKKMNDKIQLSTLCRHTFL